MSSVSSDVLARMVANARLFQVGAGAQPARLIFTADALGMSITDGQVYLQDGEGGFDNPRPFCVHIQPDVLKQLDLDLRKVEGDIDLDQKDMSIVVNGVEYPINIAAEFVLDELKIMNALYHNNLPKNGTRAFALMPNRFMKFSRIKTPGEYPMDFRQVWHRGIERELVLFKAGPTVSGAVAILERKVLEEIVDSATWLW